MENISYKAVYTHIRLYIQYSLPEDEHKMFKTCKREEEMN